MNNIYDKGGNPCSGCGVCAAICPKECITISLNDEGFFWPIVDEDICISCGICKKVCYQFLERKEDNQNYFKDKKIYASWSNNEKIRSNSSSGGVGQELILKALDEGYYACGAIFDAKNDLCKHKIACSDKSAEKFSSSKYLQSYTIDAFSKLKEGKRYIVVGTPCQIYGLRKWLQVNKWEYRFVLVDFFCHGTPSYLLWQKYKNYIQNKYGLGDFKEVVFRSKEQTAWHSYAMKIKDHKGLMYNQTYTEDLFFKFFLSDSCLSKSCYNCLLRINYCSSDIRLGDFWGSKYAANDEGVTLVVVNTEKGSAFWKDVEGRLTIENCKFADLMNSQPKRFVSCHPKKKEVFNMLEENIDLGTIYNSTLKKTFLQQFKILLKNRYSIIKHIMISKK